MATMLTFAIIGIASKSFDRRENLLVAGVAVALVATQFMFARFL